MKKEEYDIFNLITQAQIGIKWIFESTYLMANSTHPINEVVNKFKDKNENILVFNQGTVLMFAYVSLVLPKQNVFEKILSNNMHMLNLDKFNIVLGNKNDIVRRVRNALAHGHIFIKNDRYFVFKDKPINAEKFNFVVEISFSDFDNFTSEFYQIMKTAYFDIKKCKCKIEKKL